MNILLFSRYENLGASSRYRSYQYLPHLRSLGHKIHVAPLLSDRYVRRLYSGERLPMFEVAASYLRRCVHALRSRSFDLIWIEYEAFPWVPYAMEAFLFSSRTPYVVDLDDAVFHRYDQHSSRIVRTLLGKKIDRVMRNAALVIAGNDYLAERAREAGASRVEILPTVVDLNKYRVVPMPQNDVFTIGWIGTPRTSHYLMEIREALRQVCRSGAARVVAIGAAPLDLEGVPCDIRPWSEETEVEDMLTFDVGIMPLLDTPWERGKCGHKLIQYMACSRPVVASPVGVNRSIVEQGVNGFLASDTQEWVNALNTLQENRTLRKEMGKAGRKKIERQYSLNVTAPRLEKILNDVATGYR